MGNNKNEISVVIIDDTTDELLLEVIKDKKCYTLEQFKSYLFIALKLAKCDHKAIKKAFELVELAMNSVPSKDAVAYMRDFL